MSWTSLKNGIATVIKTNGNQEITGNALQGVLNSMVNALGAHATFAGMAIPSTNPGTPDGPIFYLAIQTGSYPNFGSANFQLSVGELGIFSWDGTTWEAQKFISGGGGSDNHFYGYFSSSSNLPHNGNVGGYAYVGESLPFAIYNATSSNNILTWTDSGSIIDITQVEADNEDLVAINNKLKLKDRQSATNQKGYKILRKGASLASQMTSQNTIYEVRYAFDLDGGTLNVPSGCVLRFNGGLLANGTITGSDTRIEADPVRIFGDNTSFGGTWNVYSAPIEWYGTIRGTESSVCAAISANALYDITKVVKLNDGVYYATSGTTLKVRGALIGVQNGRDMNGSYLRFTNVTSGMACVLVGVEGGSVSDREKTRIVKDLTIYVNKVNGVLRSSALVIGASSGVFLSRVSATNDNIRTSEFSSSELADPYNNCNYGVKVSGHSEFLHCYRLGAHGEIGFYAVTSTDYQLLHDTILSCGSYGLASYAGVAPMSNSAFRNISMNQGLYGMYITSDANNGSSFVMDNFRIEQLRYKAGDNGECVTTNIFWTGYSGTYPKLLRFSNGHLSPHGNGIVVSWSGGSTTQQTPPRLLFESIAMTLVSNSHHILDASGCSGYVDIEFKSCNICSGGDIVVNNYSLIEGETLPNRNSSLKNLISNVHITRKRALVQDIINYRIYDKAGYKKFISEKYNQDLPYSTNLGSITNGAAMYITIPFESDNNSKIVAIVLDVEIFNDNVWGSAKYLFSYAVTDGVIDHSASTMKKLESKYAGETDLFYVGSRNDAEADGTLIISRYNGGFCMFNRIHPQFYDVENNYYELADVTKVGDNFYVTSSLDGGSVVETSILVTEKKLTMITQMTAYL